VIKYSTVLVSFPFDDISGSKLRPALCLTEQKGRYKQVIVAFISSNLKNETLNSDILVLKNSSKWTGTGLKVDSLIRLHKLTTVSSALFKRKLGEIYFELKEEVE
jgi:mRNA interferase MazF